MKRIPKDVSLGYKCLFCASTFEDNTKGLEKNAHHMLIEHGLFVPNRTMLWDIRSFLGYLATQVQVWHECLYCGITKATTRSLQDHMRDRGHCMINFEKEPELAEFWERGSQTTGKCVKPVSHHAVTVAQKIKLSPRNLVRSSGLCSPVEWKPKKRQTQQSSLEKQTLKTSSYGTQPRKCRQVRRRDEFGVKNITSQQRHALVVAVKRSQKDQAIAGQAQEWSYARRTNEQKHDQAHGALSWAKGGMHNLLPR